MTVDVRKDLVQKLIGKVGTIPTSATGAAVKDSPWAIVENAKGPSVPKEASDFLLADLRLLLAELGSIRRELVMLIDRLDRVESGLLSKRVSLGSKGQGGS